MKTADGYVVTTSVIERIKQIFSVLPAEQKDKCSLCDETLTHVIKKIEADAQVSNREACRFMSNETGKPVETIRTAIKRVQGQVGSNEPKNDVPAQQLSIVDKVAEKMGATRSKLGAIKEVSKETGVPVNTIKSQVHREQKKYAEVQTFNRTDDAAIEWAKYTWNPVTGCKHGCKYCYAKGIAERRMGAYEDIGFTPHLHEERLLATENLPNCPDEDKFCFVVSMGDLFGEWVPKEWIDRVMDAIRKAPDWTFLLLTKNPERYADLGEAYFPENVWLGASGGNQELVIKARNGFDRIHSLTKFLSCEPLQGFIRFTEHSEFDENFLLSIVDWVIVGAQSNPEFQPDPEWVVQIICQCRQTDTKLYFKPNLRFNYCPKERPE